MMGVMTTPHDTVQELDEVQAWEFLTAHRIGRLAIVIGGEPDIFPVNYVVDGQSLVFRTAEGSKLLAASLGGRMAFQVDEWTHEGAVSVLAHGTPGALADSQQREGSGSAVPEVRGPDGVVLASHLRSLGIL